VNESVTEGRGAAGQAAVPRVVGDATEPQGRWGGEPPRDIHHPRSTLLLVRRKQREKQIIVARTSRRTSDPKPLFVPFPTPLSTPLRRLPAPLPRAASKCRRCPYAAGPPPFPCYSSYRFSPPPLSSSPRAPQQPPSEVSPFLLSSSIALRIYNE